MSLYVKQVEMLVALQEIDRQINELDAERTKAPAEVEALKAQCNTIAKEKALVTEKLDCLKDQEGRLSIEIDDDGAKIKKSKNKLMLAGNTREYHAMMREVDSLDRLNKMREEEKTALAEELNRQQEHFDLLKAREDTLTSQITEKMSTLDTRMRDIKEKMDDLSGRRGESQGIIPPPILGRYEFIRSRLPGLVVVPVEQGICGGCHISIPPQSFIELQKGTQILSCPNCQRIIYWAEHIAKDESAPSPRPVAVSVSDEDGPDSGDGDDSEA